MNMVKKKSNHIPLDILKKRLVTLSEIVAKRNRAGESLRKPAKRSKKSKKSKKK